MACVFHPDNICRMVQQRNGNQQSVRRFLTMCSNEQRTTGSLVCDLHWGTILGLRQRSRSVRTVHDRSQQTHSLVKTTVGTAILPFPYTVTDDKRLEYNSQSPSYTQSNSILANVHANARSVYYNVMMSLVRGAQCDPADPYMQQPYMQQPFVYQPLMSPQFRAFVNSRYKGVGIGIKQADSLHIVKATTLPPFYLYVLAQSEVASHYVKGVPAAGGKAAPVNVLTYTLVPNVLFDADAGLVRIVNDDAEQSPIIIASNKDDQLNYNLGAASSLVLVGDQLHDTNPTLYNNQAAPAPNLQLGC